MNQELTAIHQEVLQNLESIHGALLRMNQYSIGGNFGVLKWIKRIKRLWAEEGRENAILELTLISCGFKSL